MFLTIHSRCSSSVLKRSGLRDTAPESGQNLRLNTCINTAPGAKHPSNTHLPLSSTLPHLIMPPWPKASQATDMLCLSKLFLVLPGFEKHRTAFTTYCIMARSVIDLPTLHLHLHISGVLISCFPLVSWLHLAWFFFLSCSRYPSIARFASYSLAKMVPSSSMGCCCCSFKIPYHSLFRFRAISCSACCFEIPTPLAFCIHRIVFLFIHPFIILLHRDFIQNLQILYLILHYTIMNFLFQFSFQPLDSK